MEVPYLLRPPRTETLAERVADGVVHLLGFIFAVTAAVWLAVRVWPLNSGIELIVSLSIYSVCLLLMITMSAIYNIWHRERSAGIWRRLDHAAIFAMIAGSYTPFAAMIVGGWSGAIILTVVWTAAIVGMAIKIIRPEGLGRWTVPVYLMLGWMIVFALPPVFDRMSFAGILLLATGGLLYSFGTIFYQWRRLPFQNAIWHVFVLVAAICQYGAILTDVAVAAH